MAAQSGKKDDRDLVSIAIEIGIEIVPLIAADGLILDGVAGVVQAAPQRYGFRVITCNKGKSDEKGRAEFSRRR